MEKGLDLQPIEVSILNFGIIELVGQKELNLRINEAEFIVL